MMKNAPVPSHGTSLSGANHRMAAPRYMKLAKMRKPIRLPMVRTIRGMNGPTTNRAATWAVALIAM